jgi:hypothetical protein
MSFAVLNYYFITLLYKPFHAISWQTPQTTDLTAILIESTLSLQVFQIKLKLTHIRLQLTQIRLQLTQIRLQLTKTDSFWTKLTQQMHEADSIELI